MNLAFGLNFTELYTLEGLKKLDQIFLKFLQDHDHNLYKNLLLLRSNSNQINQDFYSNFLLEISPILDDFLAEFFNIEEEISKLRQDHKDFDIIYECKRKFVQRWAIKKYPQNKLKEINIDEVSNFLEKILGEDFTEKTFANHITKWQLNEEKHSVELDQAAKYAAFMVHNNNHNILFSVPSKIDKDNLIDTNKINYYKKRVRSNFDFFDPEFNLDRALNHAHYCIYCHKLNKDSCSKGLSNNANSPSKPTNTEGFEGGADCRIGAYMEVSEDLNPMPTYKSFSSSEIDKTKPGCPLKQKISEMNYVKSKGFNLAALAIIMIDNPMVAATGHRICSDCINSCIYQKQEPVDIPLVESNILQETLKLPYGAEIYLLLTNWNPINISNPLPSAPTNYKILVTGLGPAGFSLSYYLLRDGHNVVAIDGLKITPLPFDINKSIQYWHDFTSNLSEKIPRGFGGVAEYGITSRWDKNNLTLLRLVLQRNSNFKILDGVNLSSNLTIDQAFNLGFDHIALCIGAGKPKMIKAENFLAKGVRTASDILMTLQSGGAFLEKSITNLLIRMPIVVIGAGLTSTDVATETLLYYKLQVEKFYKKYKKSIYQNGKEYTELNWTEEDRLIAEEFITHAKLFEKAQDQESVKKILDELGGTTIYYRGQLTNSHAYQLNPDEIMYAMAAGVKFIEDMIPIAINVDEYNYTKSIEFDNLGTKKEIKARTVIVAIGTESQSDFLKNLYVNNRVIYSNITYFGDCNPESAGSVVKALASSKEGYKFIGQKLISIPPNFSGNYLDFFAKLTYLMTSTIQEINILSDKITELVIHSPLATENFQAGQFFRLQNYSNNISEIMEPIAVTGAYVNHQERLIHLIIWNNGKSSKLCRSLSINDRIVLMGPNGKPTEILKNSNIILIGNGLGNAVLCTVAKSLKDNNCKITYFAGYKNLQDRFYQEKIESFSDIVIWSCEEGILTKNRPGDISIKGNIIDSIKMAYSNKPPVPVDRIISTNFGGIAQDINNIKNEYFSDIIPLIVSVNSPMQCMMKGICGQCIQKVTDERQYIFTCACQEQDAKVIDFQGLKNRLEQNSLLEKGLSDSLCKYDFSICPSL
ncbi:MAG: FAD-dependent oxidoreductase [Rickettsia endosymbiont of Bryobia graminum]|nr:FAD-dependent oxidoreductase [Rickettsia endosymbiont of Bryobia graminum]